MNQQSQVHEWNSIQINDMAVYLQVCFALCVCARYRKVNLLVQMRLPPDYSYIN